jgi:hypothetical protein
VFHSPLALSTCDELVESCRRVKGEGEEKRKRVLKQILKFTILDM